MSSFLWVDGVCSIVLIKLYASVGEKRARREVGAAAFAADKAASRASAASTPKKKQNSHRCSRRTLPARRCGSVAAADGVGLSLAAAWARRRRQRQRRARALKDAWFEKERKIAKKSKKFQLSLASENQNFLADLAYRFVLSLRMEITPATPRASADGGGYDDDGEHEAAARPNEGMLGGLFRRRGRRKDEAATTTTAVASTATSPPSSAASRPRPRPSDESASVFLLLAALMIALTLVAGLHWSALSGMEKNLEVAVSTSTSSSSSSSSSSLSPLTVFSPHDLLASLSPDGKKRKKTILVAFAGEVFDVGPDNKHYGPGGDYSHFAAGRDATRAFATGDFERDLTDSVEDLLSDDDSVQSFDH